MTSSTPSSLSRYRPAILVLTGAAAAYAAYLVYRTLQEPQGGGLRRSPALRGPNVHTRRATARAVARLRQNDALGEFDFFGHTIVLDAANVNSPEELREIARINQPDASPAAVEIRIGQFYETFYDRLLGLTFPSRALDPSEANAIQQWLAPSTANQDVLIQALQRHTNRFSAGETNPVPQLEDAESIGGRTEVSWRSDDLSDDAFDENGQTLQRTLYHIAEERARQEGVVHRGITCNACDTKPIRGVRWRCANCVDFDLCSDCEASNSHTKTHIFYKIRVPAPYFGIPKHEPVYPGRPQAMSPSILPSLKKRLVSETKMEGEEIEALWDQFTCLAATEWDSDPNGIGWALDRRGFSQAFIPRYSTFIAAPNLVYDRIFSYYDSDHNGKIGFEEFVKGLDGMHSRDPKRKFRIVFDGYDIDGDGYISRRDVLRIFRAYYAVEKEATRNFLAEQSDELSARGALEAIHSSQPLGATFTQQAIHRPFSPTDRLGEKSSDQAVNLTPILRDDTDDTAGRADILRDTQLHHLAPSFGIGDEEQEEEAIRERWARRQYYVDEEEGLAQPEGVEDLPPIYQDYEHPDAGEGEESPSLEQQRPRGSRSSSKVRFQDDIDEIRSNASTSSRPFGERWGGYEIPEPEKDFGKEVLYQITQQAFNELLDPLFREKEDNAMIAHTTRVERRKLANPIDEAIVDFKDEEDMNKTIILVGMFTYTKYLMRAIEQSSAEILKRVFESAKNSPKERSDAKDELEIIFTNAERLGVGNPQPWPPNWQPTALDLWNAKLCRLQLQHEWVSAVLWQLEKVGWAFVSTSNKSQEQGAEAPQKDAETIDRASKTQTGMSYPDAQLLYRDPTMPQFRPNSVADIPSPSSLAESTESDSDDTSISESSEVLGVTPSHTNPFSSSIFIVPIGSQFSSVTTSEPQSPLSTAADTVTMHPASNLINIPLPPPPPLPPPLADPTAPFSPNNEPVIFWIDINTSELSLEATPLPEYRLDYQKEKQLQRMLISKIRRRAMNESSPLHIPMLASLVEVEKEIIERKGSGLVSYEEFEEKMIEENLRFMESWMDWVSF